MRKNLFMMLLAFSLMICLGPANVGADDISFEEIISPTYEDAQGFSEGLAPVKKNGKWGFIDEDENVVIDFKYDYANPFSEDKAIVAILKREKGEWNGTITELDNLYWGFIDKEGNYTQFYSEYWGGILCISFKAGGYQYAVEEDPYFLEKWTSEKFFYNDIAILSVYDNPVRNAFDTTGKEILVDTSPFHSPTEGIIATYAWEPLYYDMNGNVLFKDKYFATIHPFNQGLAPVGFYDENSEFYYTFMTREGRVWPNFKFYNFYVYDIQRSYQIFNDNSLASIMDASGKWGAINKEGETIIPFQYEELRIFIEGIAAFKKNGLYGYIDIHGNEVIPPQFDNVSLFINGVAVVLNGEKAYLIDKQGNKIKGSDNIRTDAYFRESSDGHRIIIAPSKYVILKENNKYGFAKFEYTEKTIQVDGVSLNASTLEVGEGEEANLLATISPMDATNKVLHWTSSNEQVATVSAYGKVTAKSAGTTVITVTTDDGKYTATSSVTVKKPHPYQEYRTWGEPLQNNSIHHSWIITFNRTIDEQTVNQSNVFILDKDYNVVDFIKLNVENNGKLGSIILENNGSFQKNEQYWIIVKDSVGSMDGKKVTKSIKLPFYIQ